MLDCWFENGLRFSCSRCSCCCGGQPGFVFLSRIDLTNLAESFNLEEDIFVSRYCREVEWHDGSLTLSLKEKENCDCVFWTEKGCSVYDVRPVQCQTYPFWKWILADEKSWLSESRSCPGIGQGRLWHKEEVLDMMQKYALNRPVRLNESSFDLESILERK